MNDILDLSKIEAGRLEVAAEPFDLRALAGEAVALLAVRAREKGLTCGVEVAPEVPHVVVGDPHRVQQILVNLVANAVKFTERGGVRVTVTEEPGSARGARGVHLAVADTGIGVPADKQALIFEAFTQADGSSTRRYGGTGLGLAICRRLVTLMGGRIWMESPAPGAAAGGPGSVFHVTLPLVAAHAKPPGVQEERPPQGVVAARAAAGSAGVGAGGVVVGRQREEADRTGSFGPERAARPDDEGTAPAGTSALPVGSLPARPPEEAGHRRRRPVPEDESVGGDAQHGRVGGDQGGGQAGAGGPELCRTIAPASGPDGTRRLRILLAEDNFINQRVATRMLEMRGHEVVVATDGRRAVEAARAEGFDLILMDVQMPELNGLEAAARIRAEGPAGGPRVPIVALTAHAMKGDRERFLEAGLDGYLAKPLRPAELDAVLAAVSVGPGRDGARPDDERAGGADGPPGGNGDDRSAAGPVAASA